MSLFKSKFKRVLANVRQLAILLDANKRRLNVLRDRLRQKFPEVGVLTIEETKFNLVIIVHC